MSESTTSSQCTQEEWEAARDAGLLFATPGTNAQDKAIHAFAEAIRAQGNTKAVNVTATGEAA